MEEKKEKIKLNLFQKIQRCRVELQNSNLKKSGKNKFAGFSYYELADFIPKVNELFDKYKLFSQFTLQNDIATLEVFDTENKVKFNEYETYESITFSSPVAEIVIKGANAIQSLGGANTYMKRYLYLNLLEIVESDSFDAVSGKDIENSQKVIKSNSKSTKNLTQVEEKEILDLMQQMRELADLTNTNYEELLKYYKVDSNSNMTLEQLRDCVKNLNLKKQKIEMLRTSGQEVE
ncbi:MAG: ERF family protein [Erysipelotrichaceae bacterium]|nr:ERF family protein [Erysipelotrichaceae bacterium]